MSSDNKTEQATPRRREKAREKGQVARSRELSSSLASIGAIAVVVWQAGSFPAHWRALMRWLIDNASHSELSLSVMTRGVMLPVMLWAAPPLGLAFVMAAAGSFAQGGLLWAPASLSPSFDRLNPAARLSQLVSITAVTNLLKSLIPFAVIAYTAYVTLSDGWPQITGASRSSSGHIAALLFGMLRALAWKSALALLLWAAGDYWLIRTKFESDLKMSRQEVRDEVKETEGNALVKSRIRRLQRQVRRRRMLQDVQHATVVVTNPTHFAIALRYDAEMAAPTVVAKGRNLLAQQIKEVAMWHGVTLVENPPLAHVLYRTVEVGQVIPAKLYTAVAEILAFVYRTQQQRAAAAQGRIR